MITREDLLDAMKDNKDLDKLVYDFGGIDKAVESLNLIIPVMEKVVVVVLDTIKNFSEALSDLFSMDNGDLDELVEEEETLFQKSLDMCDVDVKWRYEYLDQLLCDLEDESMELYEELEKANVDYEIADRLIEEYDFDVRNDLIYANKRVIDLKRDIEEVEYRVEAVSDLYDECLFNILQAAESIR